MLDSVKGKALIAQSKDWEHWGLGLVDTQLHLPGSSKFHL